MGCDFGEHPSSSLVLTRGLSTVTKFFNRPKLDIDLIASVDDRLDKRRSIVDVYFYVINNGKNTAKDLRAQIYTGTLSESTPLPEFERLQWHMPQVSERLPTVDLPYKADAWLHWLQGVIQINAETDYYDCFLGQRFLCRAKIKKTKTITDGKLTIYGADGVQEQFSAWLIATGDISSPLKVEKTGYHFGKR